MFLELLSILFFRTVCLPILVWSNLVFLIVFRTSLRKRLLGRGRKGGSETVAAGHCGARPRLTTLTLWGSPTHSGPGSAWSAVAVEGAEAPQAPPHCSAPGGD